MLAELLLAVGVVEEVAVPLAVVEEAAGFTEAVEGAVGAAEVAGEGEETSILAIIPRINSHNFQQKIENES